MTTWMLANGPKSNMAGSHRIQPLLWVGLWLVAVLSALFSRTYFPIDETRYAGVAWEMWLSGDWLVPHLNGDPYSHKPPLLFWLYNAGWWLFGVNDWWPRLVSPLFALANLFLTMRLAKRLWPEQAEAANLAPLILIGTLQWMFYATMAMFDMLAVCFTLIGLSGMLEYARDGKSRGWLITGAAIGLGILAKGPVILLFIVPPALLAPWWMDAGPAIDLRRWYAGVAGSVIIGAAIALCWAIPASISGGDAYREAIFWGQSAGRISGDEAPHARPIWWYLPLLPLVLFPWVFWPPVWRALRRLKQSGPDSGTRFVLAWIAPAFVIFSLISGKQVHYLLPLLPAFALLTARALAVPQDFNPRRDARGPALVLIVSGILLALVNHYTRLLHDADWLEELSPLWGLVLVAIGLALPLLRSRSLQTAVLNLSCMALLLLVVVHISIIRVSMDAYDMRPVSRYLGDMQHAGRPIAHMGNYHDQYHFLGRLEQPFTVLKNADLPAWLAANPDGLVLIYYRLWQKVPAVRAAFTQPYRGRTLVVWDAKVLRDHLDCARDIACSPPGNPAENHSPPGTPAP